VYVTNFDSGTVSVIDTATNAVVTTIAVGDTPVAVAVAPNGTRAYVTNFFSETVSVIDTATNAVVATIPVGNGPWGVAVSPGGDNV
jgi:YVTN family beta-propeller protein